MKKLFTAICMVAIIAGQAYGGNEVTMTQKNGERNKELMAKQRVERLTMLARRGEIEALKSLALCYLNGEGVERSMLNMAYLYSVYKDMTGMENDTTINMPEEMNVLGVRNAFKHGNLSEDDIDTIAGELREKNPAEAKAIEAVKLIKNNPQGFLEKLKEAEKEGSEIAAYWQVTQYEDLNDTTGLAQTVNRLQNKYPFLNLFLGKLYVNNYSDTCDIFDLLKGIRYIYKADMAGMLTAEYARLLLHIYKNFDSIKPEDAKTEIKRLEKIAKQN